LQAILKAGQKFGLVLGSRRRFVVTMLRMLKAKHLFTERVAVTTEEEIGRSTTLTRNRFRSLGTKLIVFMIVLAIFGGTVSSYTLSQSAERDASTAIDAFDLHGDLLAVKGYLNLPPADRTRSVEKETLSAIVGARQGIGELRAVGEISPILNQAIYQSGKYVEFAVREIKSSSPTSDREAGSNAPVLVDRAARQAEHAAHETALEGRIGGVVVLLLVVAFVGLGLLWRARQRRRQAVSDSLSNARAQFEAMVENGNDLFFLTDDDDRTQYCSPPAARFFGMSATEMCKAPLEQLIHPDDLGLVSDAIASVHAIGVVDPFDVRVRHADGGWRTLQVAGNDLSLVSDVHAVAWNTHDVTDRRNLEDQLVRQAFEDSLTGLANRALFRDRISHAFALESRSLPTVAVLMIDLDGFKSINDSMGHGAGDEALKEIAARIARSARPGDTIARLGGDEFAVLLEGLSDLSYAHEVAKRILDLVRQPLTIQGTSVQVSASIGIAVSDHLECTPESLIRDADTAMYVAKTNGRDRFARFEPAMHARATQHLRFSQDLSRALARDELVVYYQPSISLENFKLEGAEALLRWRHPEDGLIPPNVFIPIAEQNGLIVPIGRWVLERACQQAVEWQRELVNGDAFVMSVNVSGKQLNHESLIPDVRSILSNSGLRPECLTLEVTESVLMSDLDAVIARLQELKDLGVSIAIDDFGTGYSSLAYLRQLPIDILKIDKTFVDAASAGDPGGDAILRAILDLSVGLHLRTIAEGVEEESQALHVKELGCQSAQGFLYSRPMPPDELRTRFAANSWGKKRAAAGR
jgi:diguanylate cyclase (GGDEF)-like protein/PAS domain S-box-containing protein